MKLHQIFEKVVKENPNAIAAKFQDNKLTYKELNEAATQLANHLRKKLLENNFNLKEKQPIIGVHLKPSENPLIAMLAISKLGGVYVPLDTAKDRKIQDSYLTSICKDSHVDLIVSEGELSLSYECVKVYLDKDNKAIKTCDKDYVLSTCSIPDSEQNAYYCYSSGTTGEPKGIPIRHAGLHKWFNELEMLRSSDNPDRVVLSYISIGFDAHIWEYLMAWALRAPVCIAKQESTTEELARLMDSEKVTDATLVPAILDPIASLPSPPRKGQLNVYSTGSALTKGLTEKCLAQGYEVYNCYGPTEATFGLTWYQIKYKEESGKKIATEFEIISDEDSQNLEHAPMGKARFNDVEIFVLDEENNVITEKGRLGRLAYASPYMTKGYLGKQDETNKNFIEISRPNGETVRVHRTDDICELKNDNLYFLKRIGNNLKIDSAFSNGDKVKKHLSEELKDKISFAEVVSFDGPPPYSVAFYQTTDNINNPPKLNDIYRSLRNKFGNQESIPYLQQISEVPKNNKKEPDISQLKLMAKKINRDDSRPCKSPTTTLQTDLIEIWAEVLAKHNIENSEIGIADDFGIFGTSMDRRILLEKVNGKYRTRIELAAIWEDNFTVERLEQLITNEMNAKFEPTVLKKAKDNGENLPSFFLFPSITGDGPGDYGQIGAELRKAAIDQAVYAFKAPGIIDTSYNILTIQQLINHYYILLKKTQPKGPYYLGGWSSGALIAYGVAQKLKENGDEIRYLALIDEAAPVKEYDQKQFARDLFELVKHLPAHTNSEITIENLNNKSCEEQINFVFKNLTPKQDIDPKAEDTLAVVKQFLLGLLQHKFTKIDNTEIHIFYTDKTLQNNTNNVKLNWDQYGSVAKTTRVGENHLSPIKQPQILVEEIASQIKLHARTASDGKHIAEIVRRDSKGSDDGSDSSDSSQTPTFIQSGLVQEEDEKLVTEVQKTVYLVIQKSLKTPCNVLTVLQLLHKIITWYILALDKLSAHEISERKQYTENEKAFNEAVLIILAELKTKAIGQNKLPDWLDEWLQSVNNSVKETVTDRSAQELLNHRLALKNFVGNNNSKKLETTPNNDTSFSSKLKAAGKAIRNLEDSTYDESSNQSTQNLTLPLFNTLVDQTKAFATRVQEKEANDFKYTLSI